jgi:hypothetical protein
LSPASLPSPGETPEFRALVASHGHLVDRLYEQLQELDIEGVDWILLGLYLEIIQLGKSVHTLAESGSPDEAISLTRAMLSATFSLAFIVRSTNPPGWAFNYWMRTFEEEERLLIRELRTGKRNADVIQNRLRALAASKTTLDAARKSETLPRRSAARRLRGQASQKKKMAHGARLDDMYEREYDFASNFVHVGATMLYPTAYSVNVDGALPPLGPHFRPPLPTLAFSAKALLAAADVYIEYLGVDGGAEYLDVLRDEFVNAINDYRRPTFPNSMFG